MAEPISHSAVVGGAAYMTGQSAAITFLGASPEAFILGLIGAIAVCAWQESFDEPRKVYAGIFLAMLLAGCGSPAVAVYITKEVDYLTEQHLFYILPLVIGVVVPMLGPPFFQWAKGRLGVKK